jgi:Sulfotransferase domain
VPRSSRDTGTGTFPTFLVIGAMKGGTTSLYEYLGRHPQVFMSPVKELHFFAPQVKGQSSVDWYREQFAGANGAVAIGEASTSYTKYPDVTGVAERMAGLVPHARLVYVVRNPVERIRSQYLHQVLMGEEKEPFELAVRQQPRYVNYSRYAMQLEQYRGRFDRDRILVITSEALRSDRTATLQRVFDFIGVDAGWRDPAFEQEFHRTSEKETARPGIRRLYETRAYRAMSTRVPERWKDVMRPLTRWRVDDDRAVLTDELRVWLAEQLRDDITALTPAMPAGFDGWGIG